MLGNEVAPGGAIFVVGGGGVTSASGVEMQVTLIDRAQAELPVAIVGPVFTRRGTTDDWQPDVITGLGSRRVAVRRPSGVKDDRFPTRRDCLRTSMTEARLVDPGDAWSVVDSGGFWVKSDRHHTYNTSRAVRLSTRRCDCDWYFSVLVTRHEFSRVIRDVGVLSTGPRRCCHW